HALVLVHGVQRAAAVRIGGGIVADNRLPVAPSLGVQAGDRRGEIRWPRVKGGNENRDQRAVDRACRVVRVFPRLGSAYPCAIAGEAAKNVATSADVGERCRNASQRLTT